MNSSEIINQIISGNKQFVKQHGQAYFQAYSAKQTPFITLVSCSDSRVPLNAILPDTVNKIFSIQNIGNQILSSQGSIDYGIFHLKTPILMILGHSDCEAIKAYLNGFEDESFNIRVELDFLNRLVSLSGNISQLKENLSLAIEHNIDYQVNIACKKYRDLVHTNQLTVIGAFYDFTNDFGKGLGRVIIVNVNKKKRKEEIFNLPLFENIQEENKEIFIDRLKDRSNK